MNDIDTLLTEAGERWRAAQPMAPQVDRRRLTEPGPARPWFRPLVPVAAAAVIMLVGAVALQGERLGWFGTGVGAGRDACAVTRPTATFVPPDPYPAVPPAAYGSAWYGTADLWAMLAVDGEVWTPDPAQPLPFTQKTFWWSADWDPATEYTPAITVTGTRLDGQGSFSHGPGTNARADFGAAMLVGVEVPSEGCWRLTARYREAELSYVVWVGGS